MFILLLSLFIIPIHASEEPYSLYITPDDLFKDPNECIKKTQRLCSLYSYAYTPSDPDPDTDP